MATNQEIVRQFAGTLATALGQARGESWTVSIDDTNELAGALRGPNGTGIWFRIDADNRVTLYGSYPKVDGWEHEPRPKIGFSRTKPLAQIVKDIERRFMPAYLATVERLQHKANTETLSKVARAGAKHGLLRLSKVEEWGQDLAWHGTNRGESIDFRLSHDGGEVHISRGSLSFRTMERILMMLEEDQ